MVTLHMGLWLSARQVREVSPIRKLRKLVGLRAPDDCYDFLERLLDPNPATRAAWYGRPC